MPRNIGATLISVATFLAFGFEVIGVFTDPLSNNKLHIASVGDVNYGVLGYCSGQGCSDYQLGYTLQNTKSSTTNWDSSTQRTLSSIYGVVHIVSAFLLLVAFFFTIPTHYHLRWSYIVSEIFLVLGSTAAALAFACECALFTTNLKFSGWFGLAAFVLSAASSFSLTFVERAADRQNDKLAKADNGFFTNDTLATKHGSEFIIGRDDEKLLKQPTVNERPLNAPSQSSLLGSVHAPSYKGSQKGYDRVPESTNPTSRPLPSKASTVGTVNGKGAHPLPLPINGNPNTVGAVPRKQPGANERQPIPQTRRGPGAEPYGQNPNQRGNNTWSQMALNKSQRPASIASTQAARVPAGAYISGVDEAASEQYGPNVVRIPNVRTNQVRPAESAEIGYEKDETQSRSPLAQSKVPNFSRMSGQESNFGASTTVISQPQTSSGRPMNPMLERFVESENLSDEGSHKSDDSFHDAPSISRIPTQSPESEASHYTSVSERQQPQNVAQQQRGRPVVATAGGVQGQQSPQHAQQIQQAQQARAQQMHYHQQQQQQQQQQQHYQQYQQQQALYNPQQAQYGEQYGQQQYQAADGNYYNYNPQQPQFVQPDAYQPNYYNGSYQQARGVPQQQAYNGYYQYGYHNSGPGYASPQVNPGSRSPLRAPPRQTQRSEFALENNPDFSLGGLGAKRRPGGRR